MIFLVDPQSPIRQKCPNKCTEFCVKCDDKCTGGVFYPLYGIDPYPL